MITRKVIEPEENGKFLEGSEVPMKKLMYF